MDPQEQLPIKSKVPAISRGEVPVFACPSERSGDRGQDETHFSSGRVDVESFPARDAVTLRIVEIDLSDLESLQAPTYRVVQTQQWTGENLLTVFGQLKSFAESWCPAMPSNQHKVHSFLVVFANVDISSGNN